MRVSRRLVCSTSSHGGSSGGSSSSPSVLSVLWSELKKLGPLASFQATHVGKVMMGTDGSTPEEVAKERLHKEKLNSILAAQQAKEKAAYQQKLAAMPSWKDRLSVQLHDAIETVKATTSKKSGIVMLIQHCAASHAAEVAVEQGIDVKDVQIVLEKQTAAKGIAANSTVVGYIDAPTASEEEVMVFAKNLTKACPAAMAYDGHIEWRRRPTSSPSNTTTPSWDPPRDDGVNIAAAPAAPAPTVDEERQEGVPSGIPGGQRMDNLGAASALHANQANVSPSSSPGRSQDDLPPAGTPGARRRFEPMSSEAAQTRAQNAKKKANPFQLD